MTPPTTRAFATATDRGDSPGSHALSDRLLRRGGGARASHTVFARAVLYTATVDAHPQDRRTFGAGRRCQQLADSPQVRTPAQTSRRHRISRARGCSYGEPQDRSDDWATGQCAPLTRHLLPGRFRRLPVECRNPIARARPEKSSR